MRTTLVLILAGSVLGMPAGVSSQTLTPTSIQRSISATVRESVVADQRLSVRRERAAPFAPPRQRRRSTARIIVGAIAGGTVGFFVGAYTGAGIEYLVRPGDRNSDLAGLRGAVIGGTTGAIAGAIIGGKFF
jgi:hypothetical protein